MPRMRRLRFVTVVVLFFVSPVCLRALEEAKPKSVAAVKALKPKEISNKQKADAKTKTVEELTALVRKSVVVVSFTGRQGRQKGLGTGFIISADGLIATNLHVIGEARPITVQMVDGKRHAVTAIYATERSMDLALLKIEATHLPALELGDSDTLRQGQQIVAIGNPRGLRYSVVSGIVSARREIEGKPMIQIAIPIEEGNSGGPVLDMQGRVHGILTLKSLVDDNLGFAVAINALKPLIEKPNPIPMSRWLTIGALDSKEWTLLFGARWRQRAGHIHVEGRGIGFGGRSLAISKRKPPKLPFEVAVRVRLQKEDGAAGIVFHSNGGENHYGFYPSHGKLRLSRFDGPDVFQWQVLQEVRSRRYRPGEFNTLKVRLDKDNIQCFVNEELVIELKDSQYVEGAVGLAKFRNTIAEFKGFQVARKIPSTRPSAKSVERISKLVADISLFRPPQPELIDHLLGDAGSSLIVLRERAKLLEQRAVRLRQLANAVHQQAARKKLVELLDKKDEDIDLLHAALTVAGIDNDELDVNAYLRIVDRMAQEIAGTYAKDADEQTKLKALNKHLFEELGFHGSRTDYYNRSNSYLNEVVDDREGLPITLSVLYMELSRRIGLNVVGVGLPGHFVVRFEPKDGAGQLIDAFNRGKTLTREQAIEMVKSLRRVEWNEEFLKAQTKRAIIARMLRNLRDMALGAEDFERTLRYVETLVAINPKSAPDRALRAWLRYQTERIAEAIEDTDWILKREPAGIDIRPIRQLRKILEEANR